MERQHLTPGCADPGSPHAIPNQGFLRRNDKRTGPFAPSRFGKDSCVRRTSQRRIENDDPWVAAVDTASGKTRIVGKNRTDANQDQIVKGAKQMGEDDRFVAGDR
jgi:hypothetical protein